MKKRAVSLFLTVALCLGLAVPAMAAPAESNLPDWYFLIVIFRNVDADAKDRNGVVTHVTYSMPQEEIDFIMEEIRDFEEYMNQVGVMCAHVDVMEVDTTISQLGDSDYGSWFTNELAEPLLKDTVDLDKYDHVFCVVGLNDLNTGYWGLTGSALENGTGYSCINRRTLEFCLNTVSSYDAKFPSRSYVHEFLHFMNRLNAKWGEEYDLHDINDQFYTPNDDRYRTCYADIILNRAKGTAGTGVHPVVWQHSPRVIRTMRDLMVPASVTSIGGWAFRNLTELTRVSIPASVTSIGYAAFWKTGVKDVYYGGTEAQWKAIQIDEYNDPLTKAAIHYNSLMADVKTTDWFAQSVAWALENGIAAGTGGGKFSPGDTCGQDQILTLLWRASGSPAPTGTVSGSEYYAAALQWAKEQGLVSASLDPGSPCTRADVVTYLWKLAGSPEAKAASFTDVPAGAGCAGAVNWALEKCITSGVGADRFAPEQTCTRGEIVTFLYKALSE